jgi:hypothetical protein
MIEYFSGLHYSNMALIYLKMDNYDQAELVLRKSSGFNRDNVKEETSKNYLNYLYETKGKILPKYFCRKIYFKFLITEEVIILQNRKFLKKINRKLESRIDLDDGLYYNAKCQYNLNKAFFE